MDDQSQDEQTKKNVLDYKDAQISQEMQVELNQPLKDDTGVDPKDQEFLAMLMDKIDKKEIELYKPGTLINPDIYNKLNETARGKADYDAFNLLGTIREIHNLYMAGHRDSYQIQYLVNKIRLTKEGLEEIGGDIFII